MQRWRAVQGKLFSGGIRSLMREKRGIVTRLVLLKKGEGMDVPLWGLFRQRLLLLGKRNGRRGAKKEFLFSEKQENREMEDFFRGRGRREGCCAAGKGGSIEKSRSSLVRGMSQRWTRALEGFWRSLEEG